MNNPRNNSGYYGNYSQDQQHQWMQPSGQHIDESSSFSHDQSFQGSSEAYNFQPPQPQYNNVGMSQTSGPRGKKNQRGASNQRGRGNDRRGGHRGGARFGENLNNGQFDHTRGMQGAQEFYSNKNNFNENQHNQNRGRGRGRNRGVHSQISAQNLSIPEPRAMQIEPEPTVVVQLSQEEIEFNDQFDKWEKEFDHWKAANVNHPDKVAYQRYEEQFEQVRAQLLKRRDEMQRKKLQQQLIANPPMTSEQLKFKSAWNAEASQAANSKNFASTSLDVKKSQSEASLEDIQQYFLQQQQQNDTNPQQSFHTDTFENFDVGGFGNVANKNIESFSITKQGIPGLDLVPTSKQNFHDPKSCELMETISIDEQIGQREVPKITPPNANFRPLIGRYIVKDIRDILYEPERSRRPAKILILIRGAPGSGKTYLANLIKEEEIKMGNSNCLLLSVNPANRGDRGQEELLYTLRDTINEDRSRFIVLEIDGGRLLYFNKFVHLAQKLAPSPFKCFAIEINQTREVCLEYNRNNRTEQEIDDIMRDLANYRTPLGDILDPTSLLEACKPAISNDPTAQPSLSSTAKSLNELAQNLTQFLEDKNVMNILHSHLKAPQPLMDLPGPSNSKFGVSSANAGGSMNFDPQFNQNSLNIGSQFNQNSLNSKLGGHAASAGGSMNFDPQFNQNSLNIGSQFNQNSLKSNFGSHAASAGGSMNFDPQFNQNSTKSKFEVSAALPHTFDSNFEMNAMIPNSDCEVSQSSEHQQFDSPHNPHQITQQQTQFIPNPTQDESPVFTPSKITDYKHVHMPTFTETLMEFKIFKVVEYAHKTTWKLMEFVKDIDTDKIIDKRKSVALRKKILEYLKSAEKPEDTVSNPTYPRNWEAIKQTRPPRCCKRRKKMTQKIRRVKKFIDEDWMRKGYEETMDLEDISSDDDVSIKSSDDWLELPGAPGVDAVRKFPGTKHAMFVQTQSPAQPVVQKGTLPDFNHFGNKNFIDIYNLLWSFESKRPQRVMIILRGAPGSGKSHLAGLIRRKEALIGRKKVRIASKNDFYDCEDDDTAMSTTHQAHLVKFLERIIKDNLHDVIVVDDDNVEMAVYMKLHEMGTSQRFAVYTIELFQTLSFCLLQKKSQNVREGEIKNAIETFDQNRTPSDHTLLNPRRLYEELNCLENPALVVKSVSSDKDAKAKECVDGKMETSADDQKNANEDIFEEEVPSFSCEKEETSCRLSKLKLPEYDWHNRGDLVGIEDLLEKEARPEKMLIILRGAPGSGKTYLAKLIEKKEETNCNDDRFKLLSYDRYFIAGTSNNSSDLEIYTGKVIDELRELASLESKNFFVLDADFCDLSVVNEVLSIGKDFGYKVYAIELNQDDNICLSFNHHNVRQEDVLKRNEMMRNQPTPSDIVLLDPEYLYNENRRDSQPLSDNESEEEISFGPLKKALVESKWDVEDEDGDAQGSVIARLDGTRNKTFERLSMAEYLKNEDEWTMRPSTSSKKRVRWADIEEKKVQERMRDIGFIVGQTDWNRMTDTSDGRNALEKTKYIEPRKTDQAWGKGHKNLTYTHLIERFVNVMLKCLEYHRIILREKEIVSIICDLVEVVIRSEHFEHLWDSLLNDTLDLEAFIRFAFPHEMNVEEDKSNQLMKPTERDQQFESSWKQEHPIKHYQRPKSRTNLKLVEISHIRGPTTVTDSRKLRIPIINESSTEVNITKVFEYDHKTNRMLMESLQDIDIEKIIKERNS